MIGSFKTEIVDQPLHMLWCWLTLTPLILFPNGLGFALTGWLMCLIREISQRNVPVTWAKIKDVFATEKFDMCFWTLGGYSFWWLFVR